jgi:short subunit dehydrogenase-like uncharacterized protein
MTELMIYGGTGYTGRMASEYAKSLSLNFVLAGRTEAKVKTLASTLNVPHRVFDVDDAHRVDSALNGIRVLLNCAGPFARTAKPLIDACIRNKVHYLDISAELDSYLLAEKRDAEAKEANILLLPGAGSSVAMLGCLAGHVVERVESPSSIDIALHVSGPMSRGSAVSAANFAASCLQRLRGELVEQDAAGTRQFNFDDGNGDVDCFPVTLPDLITLWKSTSVANIRTFVHASGDAFVAGDPAALPDGPSVEQREANPYHVAVSVTAADGNVTRAVLHTVNGYTFTPVASVEAAKRLLTLQVRGGFQTPVGVFGSGFVESIPGSSILYL